MNVEDRSEYNNPPGNAGFTDNDSEAIPSRSPSTAVSPTDGTIDILVPLQRDGQVLGDKVYIPETFFNQLFTQEPGSSIGTALIDQADYHLQLSPIQSQSLGPSESVVDSLERDQSVRLTVRLKGSVVQSARRVQLPYRAENVRWVRNLQQDGVENRVRYGPDEEGWIWVDTRGTNSLNVELALRCQLDWKTPWVTVDIELPPLAVSTMVVHQQRGIRSILMQDDLSSWPVPTEKASTIDPFATASQPIPLGTMIDWTCNFKFNDVGESAYRGTMPPLGKRDSGSSFKKT